MLLLHRFIFFQHLHRPLTISHPGSRVILSSQSNLFVREKSIQVPDCSIDCFNIHCNGGSQVPEKPLRPPQASPNVFAHTRQHLHGSHNIIPLPGHSAGRITSHSVGLQIHFNGTSVLAAINVSITTTKSPMYMLPFNILFVSGFLYAYLYIVNCRLNWDDMCVCGCYICSWVVNTICSIHIYEFSDHFPPTKTKIEFK